MKGSLITNTLSIAGVIIFYYLTLIIISWMFSIWDTIPILQNYATAWDPNTRLFWNFILYFVIPIIIVIAFIIHTKPQTEIIQLKRFQ